MKIGTLINNYRISSNLTQTQVAEHLDVTEETVESWENNMSEPEENQLQMISELIDVSIDELKLNHKLTQSKKYLCYIGCNCNITLHRLFRSIQKNVTILGVTEDFVIVQKAKKVIAYGIHYIQSVAINEKHDKDDYKNSVFDNQTLQELFKTCNIQTGKKRKFNTSHYLFTKMHAVYEKNISVKLGKRTVYIPIESVAVIKEC